MTTKIKSGVIAAGAVDATALSDNSITIAHLNCSDGTNGQVLSTDGSGTLSFADGGVAGIVSSADATAITIDSSENVGIGTSNPNNYANLNTLTIDGTNGSVLDFESGGTLTGEIFSSSASLAISFKDDSDCIFYGNITERMRITNAGNVGIGANNPGNRLHIEGPASAHTALQIETITSGFDPTIHFVSAHNSAGMYLDGTTDNKINFYNGNGKGTAGKEITFDNNGNVGIGTNNPTVKLDIYNSSGWGGLDIDGTSGGEIRIQKAGTRYGGIYANDSTGLVILAENGVDSTLFYTGGSLRMTIASNGDVSFNGGVVKGARQTINHQGTTGAVTVSGNTYNTTITSVNVTTTGNSKLMVWAHSGQILKSFDNANPQMNIQVAGTQIGSAHDGNHYWYATAGANSTSARVFLTQFGVSGTLAAGTHTVSLIAGAYGANHTFNYQNQNCHMVIMEVGA